MSKHICTSINNQVIACFYSSTQKSINRITFQLLAKQMANFSIPICIILIILITPSSAKTNYNVLNFGAKGNGVTDSTQAFTKAWTAACETSGPTIIYVPKGRYLIGSVAFEGPCKSLDITLRIDGTLVAPLDYNVLGKFENWISFDKVSGVSILGGSLDAKGSALWACKASGSHCPDGATVSICSVPNIHI